MGDVSFGFQAAAAGASGKSDHELYCDLMEDCALGHKLGYDAAWLLEHHFSDYYPTPSPLLLMAHIAAKFPDLSLGTSVLVLPWYHPLRLAEEIAMLNSLTRGHPAFGHRTRHREDGIRCLQRRHERRPGALCRSLPDHGKGFVGKILHPSWPLLEHRAADPSAPRPGRQAGALLWGNRQPCERRGDGRASVSRPSVFRRSPTDCWRRSWSDGGRVPVRRQAAPSFPSR